MDGHAHIGRERAHFDGQYAFGDQFARARTHDADTEHALVPSMILQPLAENAQALLDRVLEQAAIHDNGKVPPDDVAAIAVRRVN